MSNRSLIQTAQLLEQAAEFADSQWTQGAYARNAIGNAVH